MQIYLLFIRFPLPPHSFLSRFVYFNEKLQIPLSYLTIALIRNNHNINNNNNIA